MFLTHGLVDLVSSLSGIWASSTNLLPQHLLLHHGFVVSNGLGRPGMTDCRRLPCATTATTTTKKIEIRFHKNDAKYQKSVLQFSSNDINEHIDALHELTSVIEQKP